jgi:DNA-binding NarL/FixJ family response regulator
MDAEAEHTIRVSIFEDNKALRESLGFIIQHTDGFFLSGVSGDAKNLEKKIVEQDPDVILMDIQMPGISGIEAVGIIHNKFPHLKVIMQTVFEDDDKIFNAICNGASGYILKSTSHEKYLEAIVEAYNGGAPLTPSIAIKVLNQFKTKEQIVEKSHEDLSAREKDVLHCLVKGFSYKMIAAECNISYETVRFHMKNIYAKLHVASMTEAVSKAIRNKIV